VHPASATQPAAAEATAEAAAAVQLVTQVEADIEQFKKQSQQKPVTPQQADTMKAALRAKCEQALAHGDRAIALQPSNPAAWRARIRALYLLDRKPAAALELGKALAQFPQDAELKQMQGMIAP
jgi:hypothetical protein